MHYLSWNSVLWIPHLSIIPTLQVAFTVPSKLNRDMKMYLRVEFWSKKITMQNSLSLSFLEFFNVFKTKIANYLLGFGVFLCVYLFSWSPSSTNLLSNYDCNKAWWYKTVSVTYFFFLHPDYYFFLYEI